MVDPADTRTIGKLPRFVPVQRVSSVKEIRPQEAVNAASSGEDSITADAEGKTSARDRSKLEDGEQTFFDQKGFVTDSMSEVDASKELARTQEEAKMRNRTPTNRPSINNGNCP